jgi:ElaB/YqjD/DUF883 family membrane-anchored ribosome-binding protein
MTTVAESVAKAASDYTEPLQAAVRENLRDVRRAVAAGRHAVEDCTDATALQVRRHPFASIGIAAGIGALVGCVIGLTLGRAARRAPGTP